MRRCCSLVPVFASLLLSLCLFTAAVAQDEPTPPADESIASPVQMAFQPSWNAESLEDFVPPGLTLEHVPTVAWQRAAVPFAGRDGKAVSFSEEQVALIIEGGTFPAQSEVQYTELPVPVPAGEAPPETDATSESTLAVTGPVTETTSAGNDVVGNEVVTVTETVTGTVTLTETVPLESDIITATAPLTATTPITAGLTATGEASPTTAVTTTVPLTVTNTISNPVESRDLVRFQLDVVDRATGEISPLERPARIVVDLRSLTQDLNPVYSQFYLAYQDAEDPLVWHDVPIQVHQADGLISAEVSHFSYWGAGVRPERWNPSWTPPAVSTFSGAATYADPIQVPPGRNGLRPSVTLSYNSRALDAHIRDIEPGAIAQGWSLAQISIVREDVKMRISYGTPQTYHPDRFRLVFNGAGYELHPQGSTYDPVVRYYAKELPGFLVHRFYDAATPNKDGIYWIVKSPDGVHYRLGYLGNAHRSEEWQEAADYHVAINGHPGNPVAGGVSASAIAWHVDTVTDPFGNQMTYHYNRKTNSESIQWWNTNHWTSFTLKTYTSRLDAIRYNYPTRVTSLPPSRTVAPLTSAAGTVILFRDQNAAVETDPITNIFIYHGSNQTAPIVEYRLTAESRSVSSPGCYNYDVVPAEPRATVTRVITRIQQFAATDADPLTADAGYSLPPTTFTYSARRHFSKNGSACFQFQYLTGYKNGYGGEVTFTYGTDSRSAGDYIYYTYNHYEWPHVGYSYFVTQMTSKDGRNQPVSVDYSYSTPCYSQTDPYVGTMPGARRCTSPGAPEWSSIVGFARTTQSFKGYASELLNTQITAFSQDPLGPIGQPTMEELKDAAGVLLTCTRTTYVAYPLGTTSFNKPDYVDRRHYSSEGGDCSAGAVGAVVSGKVIQTFTNYDYDSYGNLVVVWDDGDRSTPADDRKIVTDYRPNTATDRWIVNKPARELEYNGFSSPTLLRETRYVYDANSSWDAVPTQGALKRVRTGNAGNPPDGHGGDGFITSAQYSHDVYGNVTSITSPRGYVTTATYDPGYNLYPVKVRNHLGHEVLYEYYGFKNASGADVPLSGFQRQTGLLRKETGFNLEKTVYEYDPFGRLFTVWDELDPVFPGFADTDPWNGNPLQRIRYWDNSWNNSVTFLDPANNKPFIITLEQRPGTWTQALNGYAFNDQTFYDGFGRPIQTRSIFAEVDGQSLRREIYTSTAYDARGNVSCQTVPYDLGLYSDRGLVWPASPFDSAACTSKPRTTTTYNALSRVATVTAPDGSQTRHFYSILDAVVVAGPYSRIAMHKVVDAQNHVTASMTNARGQLMKARQYTGVYSSESGYVDSDYRYDAMGNLTLVEQRQAHNSSATTALSRSTMTYDVLGRKKSMNDADMGVWSYGYDAAGNLVWQKDANGKKLCFTYDALDRILVRYQDTTPSDACPAAPTSGSTHLATYTYDTATYGKGQVATISWGPTPTQNKDTFFYDRLVRMTKQTRLIDNRSYTLETTGFDALHRPLTVKYPSGEVVTYAYDREGENRLWAGASLLVDKVTYNARAQMVRLRRGNSLETVFSYYGATGTAGNSNYRLQSMVAGSLLNFQYQYDKVGNITLITDGLLGSGLNTQTFTYDELNRLKTAYTPSGATGYYNHTYAYDQVGNITSFAGTGYTYLDTAHKHAVTHLGGAQKFWYDANGNMTKRVEGSTTYIQAFDVENRLTSVSVGSSTTTFAYDAAGQRVKTQQPNGVKTYYPFPGYEEEVNGSTTTRRTTYSLAGQAVAVRVQVVGGSNTLYYLQTDHLGSTTALSSSATGGGLVSGSTARYYPFGAWRTTPTQTLTDRGYTGHLENMEVGLVYMNARYFVPAIGRFASADTVVPGLDNPQAWNRYAYVANNPLILTDPSGHCWGFASGLRNTFLSTTCSNLDMAATIVASPDATVAQRAFAGGYIVAEAAAGTMLTVGSAVLVAEAAPVAAGYAGTAVMQAQATAAAHPVAAGAVGGVLETAAECTMTGGGCGADAYLMGALTGGMSSASASASRGRTGPKGIDPDHHNANVLVRDVDGTILRHERFVSGSMTAEERALGFPLGALASHTEARALRQISLSEGQTMVITGQQPPCPSCKGQMNRAAKETGATISYQWRDRGQTQRWWANQE